MDAKTLEALKASIAKWERNAEVVNIEDANLGVSNCPLCFLFRYLTHSCDGCPVYGAGHYQCDGTPYDDAVQAFRDGLLTDFQVAARAEVDFLKRLLPTGENA